MTRVLSGQVIAGRINDVYPGAATDHNETDVWVASDRLLECATLLKEADDLAFATLTSLTGVDYVDHFEMIYHLLSMRFNHRVVLKMRSYGRESLEVPSVVSVWRGADLQEREVWDLLGVRFEGHPNMKRILLWEGFDGHPLRRDYVR